MSDLLNRIQDALVGLKMPLSDVSAYGTALMFSERRCGHRADSPPLSWWFSAKRR
jgi:hypothetical protein